MAAHPVFAMTFARLYPLYMQKVERKGRTQAELDTVLGWLTGLDAAGLQSAVARGIDLATFLAEARFHPNASRITGVVCGVRVEAIEDAAMQKLRWMDKLVDELAKGKAVAKVLRA